MTKKNIIWLGLILLAVGIGLHYYGTTPNGQTGTFGQTKTKGILDGVAGAGAGLLAAAYL